MSALGARFDAAVSRRYPDAFELAGLAALGPAAVYVIFTQYGHDERLQRRIAWTLSIMCSTAATVGLYEYQSGKQSLATLPYANSNDFAFILATSLPLMFFLLESRRWRPLVLG